jgi:hypothetical protein
MPFKIRHVVVVLAAVAINVGGFAPSAHASGADAVIADLQSKGYLVQINWINGFNTKSLDRCTVTNVNNPSSIPPKAGDTVYVDVRCPNHDDDDYGGIGVGIG